MSSTLIEYRFVLANKSLCMQKNTLKEIQPEPRSEEASYD